MSNSFFNFFSYERLHEAIRITINNITDNITIITINTVFDELFVSGTGCGGVGVGLIKH